MRHRLIWIAVLGLVAVSCGLKVPVEQGAGSLTAGDLEGTAGAAAGADGGELAGAAAASGGGDVGDAADTAAAQARAAATREAAAAASSGGSLFPNDTEGLSRDAIKICTHVPITGAAAVDRNHKRFGAFYFDWLNQTQGGIHGRRVEYQAYDDRYNPSTAVTAFKRCRSDGAFIIAGAAGTDQLVAVAKKAADEKVPYLMGPASVKDIDQYTPYAKMVGPDYEYQHVLLADYLVNRYGKDVNYAMIRVNSPFFTAAHDAFVARLKEHGITLAVDRTVEKDENVFGPIFNELVANNVKVVNNFTTPVHWLKMMKQRPPSYQPTWTAVSPAAGFNLVAEILTGEGGESGQAGEALVFHHFNPAYPASRTDDESEISKYPYADEMRRFQQVFATCTVCREEGRPNGKAPRDDIDWSAYLAAKTLHRLLDKAGPDITRTKLWRMLDTYKESPQEVSPSCPADFTRAPHRGAWFVNVFELGVRQWNNVATCIDKP